MRADRERERKPEPTVAKLLDYAHMEANRARSLHDLMLQQRHGDDYKDLGPLLLHLEQDIAHVYETRLRDAKALRRVVGAEHKGFDGDSWHEQALTLTASAEQVVHWLDRAQKKAEALPGSSCHLKRALKKLHSMADTAVGELEELDIVAKERQDDDAYDAAEAAKAGET